MTDSQARDLILKSLYAIRKEGEVPLTPDKLALTIPNGDLLRVANQLKQQGLIAGQFQENYSTSSGEFTFATGKLTASGIDVVEGTPLQELGIKFVTNVNNINGSTNVIVGNNNQQTIGDSLINISQLISASSYSVSEKEAAKSILRAFLEHPVSTAVLGAAASAGLSALF
jgi:hypothetical protein